MAERRFLSKEVIENPRFCEMSASARLLYTYLVVNADDDGFITNMKAVQKGCGCSAKALRQLLQSRFIIAFSTGVCVIKHWNLMNKNPPSKYKKTLCTAEKSLLILDDDGSYRLKGAPTNDDVRERLSSMPRLGQVSSGQPFYNNSANGCKTPNVIDSATQSITAAYAAEVCGDAGFKF